jgi:4-amino-4-deoxy-L-arabinose transferase-like glycosyltransferase
MLTDRPAGPSPTARRLTSIRMDHILLALLLLLGVLLYMQHNLQYFLHDDEGNYAYAAWRISQGEVPYKDFFTPQMPVFLYWGAGVVRILGPSFAALRLSSLAVTLLAGYFLYALNRETLGRPVAIFSLGLFLIEPNIFHGARFFLPEAYMLAFQLAGLYAFVLSERRRRLAHAALAGALFGLATLCKLFGALPLAGCFAYLLYASLRERRPLRQAVSQGLALGLPALLLVGLTAAIFSSITPYFGTAVFEHHTMQGAGMALAARVSKAFALYQRYANEQPPAMLLAVLGTCLVLYRRKALPTLLLWQVPTACAFALLSRELMVRHLTYLAPTLVTLMAVALVQLLSVQRALPAWRAVWRGLASALIIAAALGITLWGVRSWRVKTSTDAAMTEDGSQRLTTLIRSLAADDEQVMSDYPGLNFLAGRRSTYWAAGISGARQPAARSTAPS